MSAPAYLPLFGADYLSDTQHLSCEEHGAYLLLLIAAWGQDDCSLPDDNRKLARICRLSLRKWGFVRAAIQDFWIAENGRLTNRRLAKERAYVDQKSNTNRENARTRWDKQSAENKQSEQCERISERNAPQPQPYKVKLEPNGSCASATSADTLKPEHFVQSWNEKARSYGLPAIRNLTPERRTKLRARIAGYSLDDFREVLAAIDQSPFLRGERAWGGATFDWITKKGNFQKVLEGNYNG